MHLYALCFYDFDSITCRPNLNEGRGLAVHPLAYVESVISSIAGKCNRHGLIHLLC